MQDRDKFSKYTYNVIHVKVIKKQTKKVITRALLALQGPFVNFWPAKDNYYGRVLMQGLYLLKTKHEAHNVFGTRPALYFF